MNGDNRNVEHETLLDLAGRAETAASAHDHEALVQTTRLLLTALAMHLDAERDGPPPRNNAVLEHRARYEQELIEEFVNLVRAASARSNAACDCDHLARRALLRLRHQIAVEAG